MANTKLSAFLSILLVFASGLAVGVVGTRVYSSQLAPPARPPEKQSPEVRLKQLVDEMTREVHLNDQQVVELKQIYGETRASFDDARAKYNTQLHAEGQAIHDQQVEKIKNILRPEQIPLYDALRQRHEEARKKMMEQHHKGDIKKD